MIALAVSPAGSDAPSHAVTRRSSEKVAKVSDEVAQAVTEAFRKLSGDSLERDRQALLQWYRDRQAHKGDS